MGADPWSYFVPYREDTESALEELRQQEFAAGRYRKPDGFEGSHATIAEAIEDADADGTCSILDMIGVAESPRNPEWEGLSEYRAGSQSDEEIMLAHLAPLTPEQLTRLFGTDRPTHAIIKASLDYYNYLDRGLGLYIIVYEDDAPLELFFAGYSFD